MNSIMTISQQSEVTHVISISVILSRTRIECGMSTWDIFRNVY